MLTVFAWTLFLSPFALVAYAYLLYPLILRLLPSAGGNRVKSEANSDQWPLVSVSLPAYNEEAQIRGAVESLLNLDYPADRLQIVVVSDASSDRTDDIVREYADRGVELLRMERRQGKTAAESAAAQVLRGEIIVNTDASIRIDQSGLKPLIAAFTDPTVGVASGRDVSVARSGEDANAGEAGYVGYEMRVRALETRAGGIIGSSGCFYAIRAELHRTPLPRHLSRDFASALVARENGYRAVSIDDAVCLVPRTNSLRKEYRRKVRTIARGIQTLHHKRHLLNPFKHGLFSWMLLSHKVARWLVPWTAVAGLMGLSILAFDRPWAQLILTAGAAVSLLAVIGWFWPERRDVPKVFAVPAFAIAGNVAALHAALHALRDSDPIWEPTRREVVASIPHS